LPLGHIRDGGRLLTLLTLPGVFQLLVNRQVSTDSRKQATAAISSHCA